MRLKQKKTGKNDSKSSLNKVTDTTLNEEVIKGVKSENAEKVETKEKPIDARKVIEEFNNVSKSLDNLIKPNMDVDDFKNVLQGELDRIYEAEEKIKEDIKSKEENLKSDIKGNKVIDYWNGLNSGWFN